MRDIITLYYHLLKDILEQHRIQRAFLFGSVLKSTFTAVSDIDFLVEFKANLKPLEKGELWWSIHDSLRDLLKREIDIVTTSSLKNLILLKN